MLRLWPRDSFTLTSAHPVKTLVERLSAVTEARRPLFFPTSGPRYFGEVDPSGFEIVANISGRNSFNPVTVGDFEAHAEGTRIAVTSSLHGAVQVFMLVWISFAMLCGCMIVLAALTSEESNTVMALLALLLFVFMGWAFTGFFWLEAKRTKAELKDILEAQEIP